MTTEPLTLRSIRDFLDIPQDQLGTCLRAFRSAIESHKLAGAGPGPGAIGVFEAFVWTPPEPARARPVLPPPSADVTLDALGVRPLARARLKSIHIYTLGDCAEATPEELLRLPDVGSHTVARIQEHLVSAGLAFKRSAAAAQPPAAADDPGGATPRGLDDDSPVAELGIKRRTITRLQRRSIDTVGKLRHQSMRRLWSILGMESIRDVVASLQNAGLVLAGDGDDPPLSPHCGVAPKRPEDSREVA